MPIAEVTATTPIAELPIGKGAREALLGYGVPLAQLVFRDREALRSELLRRPTCNRRALAEIETALDACEANAAT